MARLALAFFGSHSKRSDIFALPSITDFSREFPLILGPSVHPGLMGVGHAAGKGGLIPAYRNTTTVAETSGKVIPGSAPPFTGQADGRS